MMSTAAKIVSEMLAERAGARARREALLRGALVVALALGLMMMTRAALEEVAGFGHCRTRQRGSGGSRSQKAYLLERAAHRAALFYSQKLG
ncbi:hypothetical protein V8J36_22600 [Frigidibacter sp. MR17.14]|uniref:hypothetical protein n=1 Tax=Frigidibacter sp. MR17.14 TaxID=3126509 RepID=UPI003012C2FB